MGKLIEVLGNWDGQGQSGDWKGRAIIYDDDWFEGTVVDSNSPYVKDRLIFGVYLPESRIELLKHTPPDISDPFVFRFFFKDGKWEGPFYVISYSGEHEFGMSTINVTEIAANPETEAAIIESIKNYKKDMCDDFYENIVDRRKNIIAAIKNEMEQRKNQEE